MITLFESFDMLANDSDLSLKGWIRNPGTTGGANLTTSARTGVNALDLSFTGPGVAPSLSRQVEPADEHATLILGFAVFWTGGATTFANLMSDELSTTHISLRIGGGGQLHAYAGPGLPLVGSSFNLMNIGVWNFIEFKATLASSATGSVTVRVNSANQITADNIVTQNGGTKTTFDSFLFGGDNTNDHGFRIDDLYVVNGAGSTPLHTDFMGDMNVIVLRPSDNGLESELENSNGNNTNNFAYVNSVGTQFMTFVSSGVVGDEDLYLLTLLNGPGHILGVQTVMLCNKDNAEILRGIEPLVERDSFTFAGPEVVLGTGTQYAMQVWEEDPGTGDLWSTGDLNNSQFGMRVEG